MTTSNGSSAKWVAQLPVTLDDTEKRLLEAISLLGRFAATADDDEPEQLERLAELGFLSHERQGEAFTRAGRGRGDGVDFYRLTDLGKLWLEGCNPAGPIDQIATRASRLKQ